VRYRAKDGKPRVGLLIIQPRLREGQVEGITALLIDLTRERRLEQELQRVQRLELVGRLASGIAHDFNNLLTVLGSLTTVAAGKLAADHPVQDDLVLIEEAAGQLGALSAQLLAFSKQRRLPVRPVEINRVARRTLELLRSALPKTIAVEPELSPDELSVMAD